MLSLIFAIQFAPLLLNGNSANDLHGERMELGNFWSCLIENYKLIFAYGSFQ